MHTSKPESLQDIKESELNVPNSQISEWLQDVNIVQLARRHEAFMKGREVDMGFNLFHLISAVYHRENLHSDMMDAIISPSGSHGHGDLFLHLFLNFLRQQHSIEINAEDYRKAKVVREDSRIDLLIYDETSHKAIIVENKINGAPDMDKQVVRYLKKVEADGYTCQGIVYLCLNQKCHPDQHGWEASEIAAAEPLLRVVCAYDETSEDDLYNRWLKPCLDACTSDEVSHVLRQYRQLILKLGRTLINKPIMKDFYQMVLDQQQHNLAMAVATMVNGLPAYRCQRVLDTFHLDPRPFDKLYRYLPSLAIFEGFGEGKIKLHVDCTEQDITNLEFWNNVDDDPEGKLPQRILQDIGMVDLFTYDPQSGSFTKRFPFPSEEGEMYQFIRDFKEALKKRPGGPA